MSQNPAFDSSIPVLTEVVLEPAPAEPAPAEPAPAEPAPAEPAPAPAGAGAQTTGEVAVAVAAELAEAPPPDEPALHATAPEPAAPAALQPIPAPDWDALESRIVERVVGQLQPQIDAVVRNALASAGDQIHIGLRQAIEQVVAQQVAAIQFGQKN